VVEKWLSFYYPPGVHVTQSQWQRLEDEFEEVKPVVEVPESLPGTVTFVVGRSPGPGEDTRPIGDWNNALSVEGALYCLALERLTPQQAAAKLERIGYRVVWVDESHQPFNEVPAPPAGSVITWAWFGEADLVDVERPPPTKPQLPKLLTGHPRNPLSVRRRAD
jgi:hypothetical protein